MQHFMQKHFLLAKDNLSMKKN